MVLESIAVTTAPTKTKYKVGEIFSAAGMVVTATYSDGTTKAVIGFTCAPMILDKDDTKDHGCAGERKIADIDDECRRLRTGWRAYELCGGLLLLLNLWMSAMVFMMIWRGHGEEYPGLAVYAVAAYTFYKLTIAIARVIQCRKNRSPILGVAWNMDLIEAMMSLFSLQTGLFAAFGQDFEHQTLMNCFTGGTVCGLVVFGALGMMLHGRKRRNEIRRDTDV